MKDEEVFSKRYTFPCYRASQSRGSTRRPPFTRHMKPSVKRIAISIYLNSVCYLISYTRLLTKLNPFEILLYVTFLTTKFSRFTVYAKLKIHTWTLTNNVVYTQSLYNIYTHVCIVIYILTEGLGICYSAMSQQQ